MDNAESESTSQNRRRAPTDNDVRRMAVNNLTLDWGIVNDEVSLESRTYLVKTTLPSVVISLENLMKEIQMKGLPLDNHRHVMGSDNSQRDMLTQNFDTINWLAQSLYRNNPKSTGRKEVEYSKRIADIGLVLEDRIKEVANEKERKRLSAEMEELLKKEQIERDRLSLLTERKSQFCQYLESSFKLWITSLWRKDPGDLFRAEIAVANHTEIQLEELLHKRILALINHLKTPAFPYPTVTDSNAIFDSTEPLYLLDVATINRWDCEFYVKMILRLIIDWTFNELVTFLRILSSMLSTSATNLNITISEVIFIPQFKRVKEYRDWLQQLKPCVQSMDLDHPLKDSIKKSFQGFCQGREDPKLVFVPNSFAQDTIIENECAAVGHAETEYVRFCKCIMGEYGIGALEAAMSHIEKEFFNLLDVEILKPDRMSQESDTLPMFGEKTFTESATALLVTAEKSPREFGESSTLTALEALGRNMNLSVAAAGEQAIQILTLFFESLYGTSTSSGRINLKETDSLKEMEVNNGGVAYLRVIACSEQLKPLLLGTVITDSNVNFETISAPKFSEKDNFDVPNQDSGFFRAFLKGYATEVYGTLDFVIQDRKNNADALFLVLAGSVLGEMLSKKIQDTLNQISTNNAPQ